MNTKRKLNCYFFSNLIVCFLSLNLIMNKPTTLKYASSDNNSSLVNIFEKVDTDNEMVVTDIEPDTTKISVSMKVVNSKNTLAYVKPSYNSVTGSNLVSYAQNYLGLPYVYAGESLSTGTDCSGFTRLIYREFGISLGKTVGSQLYSGNYVDRNDLQPGDLVFYGYSLNNATHVAIYMGNGLIIHQSNPRSGVKIDSINIMVYVTARRLITVDVEVKETKKEEIIETKDTNLEAKVTPEEAKTSEEEKANINDNIPKEEPTKEETVVNQNVTSNEEKQSELKEEEKQADEAINDTNMETETTSELEKSEVTTDLFKETNEETFDDLEKKQLEPTSPIETPLKDSTETEMVEDKNISLDSNIENCE